MAVINVELEQQADGVPLTSEQRRRWGMSADAIFCLTALIVAYLAYGLFYVPAIFMDDWTSVVERVVTGEARWVDLSDSRHLLFTPFLLQYQLIGLQIPLYHCVLWVLTVLTALLLYKIIGHIAVAQARTLAAVVALLFLVYPTNYTHMWLIMLGVSSALALTLLYGYLLLRYAQGAHWSLLGLAHLALLCSLGIYEAQVGIAALWALVLVALCREVSMRRRLSLLLPLLLIGLFSLWRTVGYQATGIEDRYLAQLMVTPTLVLSRLQLGYKITLLWGWTYTITHFLPWLKSAKSAGILLTLVVVALLWTVSRLGSKRHDDRVNGKRVNSKREAQPGGNRWLVLRPYLLVTLIGLLLTGAGYFPTLAVYLPSLAGIGSRFTIFASIGGSVVTGALLMMGALLFARRERQVMWLLLTALLPFLITGIVTQATVQYHNRVAWREQQLIWQTLFGVAPTLADETTVLFILPGFQDRVGFQSWRRTPLTASWEASSAIRLLYDNFSLTADVYFPDADRLIEPTLRRDGVLTVDTGRVAPYAKTIAFVYDNQHGTLQQLQELPSAWIEGATAPVPLCQVCIIDGQVAERSLQFRRLVR